MTPAEWIAAAIRHFESETAWGRQIGVSQNAIWSAKRAGRVSAEIAKATHDASGGTIPKWGLRPDLWDDASRSVSAAPLAESRPQ